MKKMKLEVMILGVAIAVVAYAQEAPADDVANNLNADDKAEYETMFTAVAKSQGGTSWSVSYELTEAATNVLQEAVNDAQTAVLDAMMDPTAQTATFAAKPGFYYAIEYGSDLNLGANTEGQMAKGATVKLDKPQMSAKCGFFRIKVSPSKIDSVAPAPVSE